MYTGRSSAPRSLQAAVHMHVTHVATTFVVT